MDIPRPNQRERTFRRLMLIILAIFIFVIMILSVRYAQKAAQHTVQQRSVERRIETETVVLDPPIKLDQEYTVITPTTKDPFVIHQGTMHGDVLYALMTNDKWVIVTPPFILVQQ